MEFLRFYLKNIFIITILSLFISLRIFGEENIVSLSKTVLRLNETAHDYLLKKEVLEKFSDIKELIQADLKNGNKNTRVDVFLLLDGLIQDNLSSLQSFLATGDHNLLETDFSDNITYNYAEKLAYALKENKNHLTTEYIIHNSKDKVKCFNYVNGKKITNNNSFFAPSGLPYYIGAYCEDNTFSVIRILSENAQQKYTIEINEYQDIEFNENFLKMRIINPHNSISNPEIENRSLIEKNQIKEKKNKSMHTKNKTDEVYYQQKSNKEINNLNTSSPEYNTKYNYNISTGIGYNYFKGEMKDQNIYNYGMNYGSLIYYNTSFSYQDFFIGIDIANIHRDYIISSEVVTSDIFGNKTIINNKSFQKQNGYFIRPNIGLKRLLFILNDKLEISGSGFTRLAFIYTDGNNNYSNIIPGVGVSPSLNIKPNNNLFFNLGVSVGFDFVNAKPEAVLGSILAVGYNF